MQNNFLIHFKISKIILAYQTINYWNLGRAAHNMGFGNIGAGRCYLRLQQHGSSCSGWTNIGEHFILSCTSATHQQRFRADVFQIPQQRQALFVVCNPVATRIVGATAYST
jgi:hypothetical protein